MKKLICIPTFNEAENIGGLLKEILSLDLGFDIVVIDDNSPDGTSKIVESLKDSYENLNLITRIDKRGFASAYIDGFQYGLDNGYQFIGEMDADFSHNPNALIEVNRIINEGQYDFIIGSRYVEGGQTVNWGIIRKIISRCGSSYARLVLGLSIKDLTGGFNFWSNECLNMINIKNLIAEGYVFQIELKYKALLNKMRYIEFPITFEDRRVGESKMSKKIVFEALFKVISLRFFS